MKALSITSIILSAVLATVLLSGKATINFTHTPMLEQIAESSHYKIYKKDGVTKIFLSDTIAAPSNYRSLVNLLLSAKEDEVIEMYLAGNGGSATAGMQISIAMQSSKAKIVTIMYGNVYSAHAVIASNGKDIRVLNPFITMMFHRPAILVNKEAVTLDEYCSLATTLKQKDRGISRRLKCEEGMISYENTLNNSVLVNMVRGLDVEDVEKYRHGHDVIIYASEFIYNLKYGKGAN